MFLAQKSLLAFLDTGEMIGSSLGEILLGQQTNAQ